VLCVSTEALMHNVCLPPLNSQSSIVGIVSRYGLDDVGFESWQGLGSLSYKTVQISSGAQGSFLEVRWLGHEGDRPLVSI
jgi:hypothetical protein